MNKKLLLSISVLSAITLSPTAFSADNTTPVEHEDPKSKSAGCAAGKCGGVKKFEEVNTLSNPQDKLVYARDGKCGLTGHSTQPIIPGKCASGLCGNPE